MSETRKIAAILAIDICDSASSPAPEDRTWRGCDRSGDDLIDPTIAVHRGRVVKRTGRRRARRISQRCRGGTLRYRSQDGMIERNAGLPPDRRIEFRVGIHLGDIVEESDGDLMGDGVNIAARLEGIASRARSACRRMPTGR